MLFNNIQYIIWKEASEKKPLFFILNSHFGACIVKCAKRLAGEKVIWTMLAVYRMMLVVRWRMVDIDAENVDDVSEDVVGGSEERC
jgi:hypothetical protein